MTIIWGFDLSQMSFSSFSTKSMMNPAYHLRRHRLIVYQLAMLIGLAAECTATYSLSKYEDLQTNVEGWFTRAKGYDIDQGYEYAHVYNNDLLDCEISTIVFCVLVACIFGADFFFLTMFPRQLYPKWYNIAKRVFAVFISLGMLGSAIASTIIIATRSAVIGNVSPSLRAEITSLYFRPPLQYNKWAVTIAYVVLLWIATVFVWASTYLMFKAVTHDERYGAEPKTVRNLDDSEKVSSVHAPVNGNGNGSVETNGTHVV